MTEPRGIDTAHDASAQLDVAIQAALTCREDDCTRRKSGTTQRCRFHELIASARYLTPEGLADLVAVLTGPDFAVFTAEERAAQEKSHSRALVVADAKWTHRSRQRALAAGWTEAELDAAVEEGSAS